MCDPSGAELNVGIDIGVARWGEKFENDVGMGWSTAPTRLATTMSTLVFRPVASASHSNANGAERRTGRSRRATTQWTPFSGGREGVNVPRCRGA